MHITFRRPSWNPPWSFWETISHGQSMKLLGVDVEHEVMSLPVMTLSSWLAFPKYNFCFGNGELASSTSSIKYVGVNKIETVTVSELNTYVVNSKPQEAGELMNYAADGNISLFPGVDLKLRFNSFRVFLWVKSMLFIMRVYKRESSIFVTGLSIYTAPVEICEKLAIPEAEWPRAIGELCGLIHIKEALF
ncbi:hypothetical protein F2Q70_00029188 [Brassica cretica]|uniref:Uncharacterized protein n=1 Tax=Brassica cretica TaxID=69181 RepID=A0A8S9FQC9_BRACR|nr:hypothetical protein F2Q70_00029188 [Brassica cretica]